MKRVAMRRLVDFGVAFMTRRGMPRAAARRVAESAVESEAFRQSTHGIVLYRVIHQGLGKTIGATAEPRVVRDAGAAGVLEGRRSPAVLGMGLARAMAMRKARRYGVGVVAVRNTNWIAALGMHLLPVAERGFVVLAWAQTSGCLDCAPLGGRDACFSTNPMALAFPGARGPVMADFSTATMSMGAASALMKRGGETERPRFLDRRGRPGCDPTVLKRGGTLMFAGCETDGHKGYALSLLVEALTAMAGGRANDPRFPSEQSFGLVVLDPARFGGAGHFAREMQRFLARVRRSRPRPGFGRVRLPGERGLKALGDCRRRGVPLDAVKIGMLRDIASANGLEPVA